MQSKKKKTFKITLNFLSIYLWLSVRNFFKTSTSISVLNAIENKNYSTTKKAYYGILLTVALFLGIYFGWGIYDKWQRRPYLMSGEAGMSKTSTIPFPAITICSLNQIKRSEAMKIPKESLDYAMLKYACNQRLNFTEYAVKYPPKSYAGFLKRVSQSCEEMIIWCFFSNELPCASIFKETIVNNKLCCVFNILHSSYFYKQKSPSMTKEFSSGEYLPLDWNPEKGYPDKLPEFFTPLMTRGSGLRSGLKFILNSEMEEYYCSSRSTPGYKIIFHAPSDWAMISENPVPASVGAEIRYRIRVDSQKTVDELRNIDPKIRRCYFSDERELKALRHYSRQNCKMECQSDYVLRNCNCIPVYLPLIDKDAPSCEVRDFDCVSSSMQNMRDEQWFTCRRNCMPNCHELVFIADINTHALIENATYSIQTNALFNISQKIKTSNLSIVHYFFKMGTFRSRIRTTYTSFTKFLSESGGILSLLIGFSLLFFAELFHCAVMSPYFSWLYKRPISTYNDNYSSKKEGNHNIFLLENFRNKPHHVNILRNNSVVRKMIRTREKKSFKQTYSTGI